MRTTHTRSLALSQASSSPEVFRVAMCTRHINDLWNPLINKIKFQQITKKMYPKWLKLGDPEYEGCSVHYLDMTTWQDTQGTGMHSLRHTKLYNKKAEVTAKGVKLQKGPHTDSKLSTQGK